MTMLTVYLCVGREMKEEDVGRKCPKAQYTVGMLSEAEAPSLLPQLVESHAPYQWAYRCML